jgi:hypothetical protein
VRFVVGLVLTLVAMTAIAGVAFQTRTVSDSRIDRAPAAIADAAADGPLSHRSHSASSDDVDLYGNEVDDAIATYSLDAAGSPYELHSPQTELPRLPSPKS